MNKQKIFYYTYLGQQNAACKEKVFIIGSDSDSDSTANDSFESKLKQNRLQLETLKPKGSLKISHISALLSSYLSLIGA